MSDNEEVVIVYPTQKLGVITRVKNKCTKYCDESALLDVNELLKYKDRLNQKIVNFNAACQVETDKEADEEVLLEFAKWTKGKKNGNEIYMKKLELLILENSEEHEDDSDKSSESDDESDISKSYKSKGENVKCENETISTSNILTEIFRNQQITKLPKNEPPKFDGSLIEFREFLISFRSLIEDKCDKFQDKFYYLLSYTVGEPHELVRSCLSEDYKDSYKRAITMLKDHYGNEYRIAQQYLSKLEDWPTIKAEDSRAICKFAAYLSSVSNIMKSMSTLNQLNSLKEIKSLMMKLPFSMRAQFRIKVNKLMCDNETIKFDTFVVFVKHQSDLLNVPLLGDITDKTNGLKSKVIKPKILVTNVIPERSRYCIMCEKDNHNLDYCYRFKNMNFKERKDFILKHKICFACLKVGNHQAKDCKQKLECKTCKGEHPTVMHREVRKSNVTLESDSTDGDKVFNMKVSKGNKVSCPAIPVILKCKDTKRFIRTYMALDSYSTSSYMNFDLLSSLGTAGSKQVLHVTTIENTNLDIPVVKVDNLEITTLDGRLSYPLQEVYAKKNWTFTKEDAPTEDLVKNIQEFKSLPFQFINSTIGILIGMNEPNLLKPLQVVETTKQGPYASRHSFGWTINGPIQHGKKVENCKLTKIEGKNDLEHKFDSVFNSDFQEVGGKKGLSHDENNWLNHVKNNTKTLPDGQFEIKLPFKYNPKFPNNYNQVYKRFLGLKRNLLKKEEFKNDYEAFMNLMIERNFVERVPLNELESSSGTWFLTHHGVRHKQKGKLRVVFDCSLPFSGVSLNSVLWKGPDLANNSVGVLLRFRLNNFAVAGDIEKMYYNIRVPIEDRNYLKFFWFENGVDSAIVQFRLTVHLFGATSSSSIANLALLKSVENCSDDNIRNIVHDSFYVDDMMCSFDSEEDAINIVDRLQTVLNKSKFNLTSFSSNSRRVLDSIPQEKLAKNVQTIFETNEPLPTERALGISWDSELDAIGYHVRLGEQPDTKRGILSTMFSIYDPLFLASPAFIRAKRLFQVACFHKLDWDEILPETLRNMWHRWREEIVNLNGYKISRCYKPKVPITEVQLHIFADGSEVAYGAVAYFVFSDESGPIVTSLVSSKVRLTPISRNSLKTVPRIELNAAKVAIELYEKLSGELSKYVTINRRIFWTDSMSTLAYIQSETAQLQRFVSNRVSYIRSLSHVKDWRYVPTECNPADLLSRGVSKVESLNNLWVSGPEFLLKHSSAWPPSREVQGVADNDPEVKKLKTVLTTKTSDDTDSVLETLMYSTSNFFKLKCRISAFLKFKAFLLKRNVPSGISVTDLREAEVEILKYVQLKELKDSYNLVASGRSLSKSDPLRKFCPFLDDNAVMRVGGRLNEACIPYDTKHPIILHGSSRLVEMLVGDVHRRLGHLGKNYILSALREKYHIIKVNKLLRKLTRECIICRKTQGKPEDQLMSDLPSDRVQGDKPAFYSTATDVFGPFYVSRGRGKAQEKRYGIVFTCLSSRAFHLEVTAGLDTDSFTNALRRFMCRRGKPAIIRSDNGTNMTSTDKELKLALDNWNSKQVDDFCKQCNISWIFQPPHASHFGGVFERQIRTVRKVLNALLREHSNLMSLTDDLLTTLFCEIENILNSRPLSVVSCAIDNNKPLTPNHLLHLQSNVEFPPGIFSSGDLYCKRRWRQAQYLADVFWSRWRKEYLHLITARQKWVIKKRSLKIGDLVLVVDQSTARNNWPLGKVVEVVTGRNDCVRSAFVEVNSKFDEFKKRRLHRPVNKLVLLIEVEKFEEPVEIS